jgi:hypothetical protein
LASTSARISSAAAFHSAARLPSPRLAAIRAPASAAFQHATFDVGLDDPPDPVVDPVPLAGVQRDRLDHRAPDVVLALVVRRVADPHRAGSVVP